MGKENHDNYEPSAEDLAMAEQLFRDVGSENVLSDADNLDVLQTREHAVAKEMFDARRIAIQEEILQASDRLIEAPHLDFPQRRALEYVLRAAQRLLDPMYDTTEEYRAEVIRDLLDDAMFAVREFDPKAKQEQEP